ncbi:guanine nucleotide exchange factor DBS-like isoform X2 [Protopterus annectens]|uniref:guanine nucleotide exchange factor DBS-like isoform X2 n=1 Tax=Protopterus annectens TaxID=7888 RepID=UPI001CF95DC2|nr:guanine nucleotide exchange factor DBS-like isoform X2 [Protopterus annectens]
MLMWLKEEEMSLQELTQRLANVITHVDEIMQQEVRPLLAVDIIEQLHRQFALLSGGRGKDGAPIITFPEYPGFNDLPDEDFLNVITYLTSIPSLEAASIGFIIIIDRRKDKWSTVKSSLTRIAGAFPGNLQLVFVLRPSRFIQRAIADIGIMLHRDDFKMKVPIVMLNSESDLHGYIDKSQLTRELGGCMEYCHSQWIHHRTAIENFALTVKTTAQMLQAFGIELAETELPNDVQCTEALLVVHTDRQDKLKVELNTALKQGTTLLTCIREPVTREPNYSLNLDERENVATAERLLVQLDETANAFEQFWAKHYLKLEQCLKLRHFEQDFRKVMLSLDNLMETQAALSNTADSVLRVEQLLKELKELEQKGQESLEQAQQLSVNGDQLIQSNHYAVDSILPKCIELRRICADFTNENKKKYDLLGKSLELHRQLDQAAEWCEAGIYLLASQAIDKCQSQEGAEAALKDLEKFMETETDHGLGNPVEFYIQYETIMTPDIKERVQRVLQKLQDVHEMFEKRQGSLKKLSAKQTRPVQSVAPHPESSPKRASPKTSTPPVPGSTLLDTSHIADFTVAVGNDFSGTSLTASNRIELDSPCIPTSTTEADISRKKTVRKTKAGIKIEVMHKASQGGSTRVLVMSESDENLCSRRSHIMNELIETERAYVEELRSIIEGYAFELDNPEVLHLIPSALQNKKEVLFGNLPEIYEFHKRTFLKELENCAENPELIGICFLKRKEELQVYEKYCQNKPRSEALWRQCGESLFFQECQRKLDHKLSLDAYLLKPVQRITKYQLLLKEMLKCSKKSDGTAELEEALSAMLNIVKSVNDSMHQIAITGFEGDLNDLGKLLMQGSFNVWTDHKKGHNKVKDLARFKPMQRHLFLYPKMLLFCKKREETSDGHEKTPSYSFKHSLKMSAVGITENVKGDNKKFEIWYNGREEVYIIQASSSEQKNLWVSEIRKVLTGQLEACREASQLHQRITENVYHAPMSSSVRFSRRSGSLLHEENRLESSNPNVINRRNDSSSPTSRQMRADACTSLNLDRSSLDKKRFTLQGLSNRRPSHKGPLGPDVKAKRHGIKSDPTPLGYEDSFPDALPVSFNPNNTTVKRTVRRSTSHIGWTNRHIPSLDTCEDFEVIPSSVEDLSTSSDMEEETNTRNDGSFFQAEVSYEAQVPEALALQIGDVVQLLQEGDNGQWLVRNLTSQKSGWVPSTLLQSAGQDNKSLHIKRSSGSCGEVCRAGQSSSVEKANEMAGSLSTKMKVGS